MCEKSDQPVLPIIYLLQIKLICFNPINPMYIPVLLLFNLSGC